MATVVTVVASCDEWGVIVLVTVVDNVGESVGETVGDSAGDSVGGRVGDSVGHSGDASPPPLILPLASSHPEMLKFGCGRENSAATSLI